MSIPIFKDEREAGLVEAIQANNTLAFTPKARSANMSENLVLAKEAWNADVLTKIAQASEVDLDKIDLYYIDCVLVSTGWNKNDDVFGLEQTWAARNSAVDKKFDFMHDEKDIIGHIVSSVVVNKEGTVYTGDKVPDFDFDIVVGTYLYKYWRESKLQDRMEQIIAEIEDDKWFVSMECIFRDFDYALISPEGEQVAVARNEETAFLTKYLRSYGGEGVFRGHKVGRYVKNFTFSGNGLVDKPANPDSIIFNQTKPFQTKAVLIQWENNMSDERVAQLEAKLAEAQAELAKREAEANKAVQAKFDAEIKEAEAKANELQSKLDQAEANIAAKDDTIAKLKKTIEESNQQLIEATERLETIEAENAKAMRMQKLVDVVDDAKAAELVDKFTDVNDDVFDELVAAYKMNAEGKQDDPLDKKTKDGQGTKGVKKGQDGTEGSSAAIEDEDDEADANENNAATNLENVKEDLSTAGAMDEDENELRQSAVAFIRETYTGKKEK